MNLRSIFSNEMIDQLKDNKFNIERNIFITKKSGIEKINRYFIEIKKLTPINKYEYFIIIGINQITNEVANKPTILNVPKWYITRGNIINCAEKLIRIESIRFDDKFVMTRGEPEIIDSNEEK